MRHIGLIIHHVCEQLVEGDAKGDCPSWWCLLAGVAKVRLTNLIRTHCLRRGYISQAEYVGMCVAE